MMDARVKPGHDTERPMRTIPTKDELTVCFAHVAYRMAERFALRGTGISHFRVGSLDELPTNRGVVLDVMPRAAVRIGGNRVSPRDRRRLTGWKVGPAVFKVD